MRTFAFVFISILSFFEIKAQKDSTFFVVITFCDSCVTTLYKPDNQPFLLKINLERILIINEGFIILEPPLELSEFIVSSFLINEKGKRYSLNITKYENNLGFISEKKGVWFKKEDTLLINNYYSVVSLLCFSSEEKYQEFHKNLKKSRSRRASP